MKLFYKRHYSSLIPLNLPPNPSLESEVLTLCKLGSLSKAIHLLNSPESHKISIKPVVYAALLQTCIKAHSFNHGLQIHSHVIKSGLVSDRFVGNSLLSMYYKLSRDREFSETRKVFDHLLERDVISWTSMISGYVHVDKPKESIEMFWEMLGFGIEPNAFTLSAVVKSCSQIGDLRLGRCFHGMVVSRGFESNCVIRSTLIDMYGRNSCLENSHRLFDEMPEPEAVCMTSVISVYTRNDRYVEALGLFYLMNRKYGLCPDEFTFGSILMACGNLVRGRQGKEVHGKVITSGIGGSLVVESSLVDMYGKCRLVEDSRKVFDRMPKKSAVSWSALLGGYCQSGEFEAVLKLFREMEAARVMYSFATVIRACAGLTLVRQGKELHCQYLRRGGWGNVIVESSLVDLYAKCGCIDYAQIIFLGCPARNLITWNTMLCGFAQNGRAEETLRTFNEMINEGKKPDHISFIGVLFACSHASLVNEGRKYFTLMTEVYKINAGTVHYNCMVDLLGRAGLLEEAEDLLRKSIFRDDLSLWAALLGACTAYSNLDVAERVARKMMKLDPKHHLSYVLLGNIYRAFGQWDDAENLRKIMEERGVKKMPGKSWIDIKNKDSSLDLAKSEFRQNMKVIAFGE